MERGRVCAIHGGGMLNWEHKAKTYQKMYKPTRNE